MAVVEYSATSASATSAGGIAPGNTQIAWFDRGSSEGGTVCSAHQTTDRRVRRIRPNRGQFTRRKFIGSDRSETLSDGWTQTDLSGTYALFAFVCRLL